LPQTPIHLTDWRRLGESDPTLVLIHGSAQGSRIGGDHHFSAQSRLAMRGWRMLVPDRPGHGRSPAPGRPDDPQADGAWVAELLGDGAHLVGHSFGGCVALAAAAIRPEAVRSLTLIEPALQNLIPGDPDIQARAAQLGQIFATAKSPADIAAGFLRWAGIPSDLRGAADPAEMEHLGQGLRQIKLPSEADSVRRLEPRHRCGRPCGREGRRRPLCPHSGRAPLPAPGLGRFQRSAGYVDAGGGRARFSLIRNDHEQAEGRRR